MKRIIALMLAVVMLATMFTGCGIGMTAEEKAAKEQAELLARLEREEKETGVKRLISVNLDGPELALKDFITGLKNDNGALVAAAIGSPNVFTGNVLYGWILGNQFEALVSSPDEYIRITTTRSGTSAEMQVLAYTDKDVPYTFKASYEGGRWVLTPPTGLVADYTFNAPSKNLYCNGVSLSEYAIAAGDNGYTWTFQIPRMPDLDESPDFVVKTNLGEFDADLHELKNENIVLANITDEQKQAFSNQVAVSFAKVYEMLRNNASESELSSVLLSKTALMSCYPKELADREVYINKLATITGVSVFEDDVQSGYPQEYTYRLSGDDGITMNVKLKVSTTAGDSRQKVNVVMQNFDGDWKIISVVSKNNENPFAKFDAYNPAW